MATTSQRAREVRANVFNILEASEEARNDDRVLVIKYWNEIDGINYDATFPHQFISRATTAESITRARRAIQSTGLFLPTQETVLRRRHRQQELQEHYSSTSDA